jgi:transcriptional regulator with XRE-family HTH domain
MNLDKRIGENAKTVRNRLGLSQAEFAYLLNTRSISGGRKWHQKTVSALENGSLQKGTWRDLWDLSAATGLAEAWWVSHEIDLRDLNADKPLSLQHLAAYEPHDDLHPINLGVTDPYWLHRDDVMHLPNPDFWTKPLQAETLPIRIAS